ncbi:hypothetical protein Hanom_Chr03g00235901 [Helianthus anomalus]
MWVKAANSHKFWVKTANSRKFRSFNQNRSADLLIFHLRLVDYPHLRHSSIWYVSLFMFVFSC